MTNVRAPCEHGLQLVQVAATTRAAPGTAREIAHRTMKRDNKNTTKRLDLRTENIRTLTSTELASIAGGATACNDTICRCYASMVITYIR